MITCAVLCLMSRFACYDTQRLFVDGCLLLISSLTSFDVRQDVRLESSSQIDLVLRLGAARFRQFKVRILAFLTRQAPLLEFSNFSNFMSTLKAHWRQKAPELFFVSTI